jgi:hypothetical protein
MRREKGLANGSETLRLCSIRDWPVKTARNVGLAVAAVMVVTAAHADPPKRFQILPPVEYDHPYRGKLTLRKAKDQAEIRRFCSSVSFNLGFAPACGYVYPDRCDIMVLADGEIRKLGLTPEVVLRHELAHCNGWHEDHRGARWWPD